MRIVVLDTATPVIGVAAYRAGECVFAETTRLVAGADGWLTPAMARALEVLDGLDAVAVTAGPGAFTGLRVGMAHALGLAEARQVPVIAVPTLALRAAAAPGLPHVVAALDARKGRFYTQSFDTRGPVPVALGPPQDADPGEIDLVGAVVVGEGLDALAALGLEFQGSPLADDATLRAAGPLLATLARLDPASVTPQYLREPDARPPVLLH